MAMNENLFAGCAALTTAEEYGAAPVGDTPATTTRLAITLAIAGAICGVIESILRHC